MATLEALTTLVYPIASPKLVLTIGCTRVVRASRVVRVVIILNHDKQCQRALRIIFTGIMVFLRVKQYIEKDCSRSFLVALKMILVFFVDLAQSCTSTVL
jgi:hypothetical protein